MREKLQKSFILLTFIIGLTIPIVCAFSNQMQASFFTVDHLEKSPGDTIEMTIDLAKISLDEFTFTLASNIDAKDIYIGDDESVLVNENNNELELTIKKSELNLEQVKLYYQIPDEIEIGNKITLTASIISFKEEIQENKQEQIMSNEIQNDVIENMGNINDTQIVQIEITIVEKIESPNFNQVQDGNSAKEEPNRQEQNQKENNIQMESQKGNIQQVQNNNRAAIQQVGVSTTTQTVTYNGSSNNYLKTLAIEDQEFTTDFSKINTTYFVTVGKTIKQVNVLAEAEEDETQICIYGNTNLQVGLNKILVSVTAENGDVRVYRIYITREGNDT